MPPTSRCTDQATAGRAVDGVGVAWPPAKTAKGPSVFLVAILESTFYDIAPARKLPMFDPTVTVKQFIFPKRWLPHLNRFLRRHAAAIGLAYVVGLICRALSVAVPAHTAQWTAIATLPLQLLAVLTVVWQFRLSFLKYLLRTYDFWFFFAMNIVWAGCLARYLRDWRVAIVPFMWIDVQNATLLDAFVQDFRAVVSATWIWCLFLVATMAAISLDFVDGVDERDAVFVAARRAITVKEMLLNAIGTVVILIGRILYRKRAALKIQQKDTSTTSKTLQSITLTWPLKLQERSASCSHEWQVPVRRIHNTTKLQLHLTLRCKPLQASDVVFPGALAHLQRPTVLRWIARLVGVVGFVATPMVCGLARSSAYRQLLAMVAAVCTVTYAGLVVCFYQRQLFALLVVSFDFAFISLQLTAVHLCVADAFEWQATPTLCILSSWLWLHLVLTIDALTPAMRHALGFFSWFRVPVLLLTQLAVVLLWLELSYWDSQGLRSRCFLSVRIGQRELKLHVVPCLLSRLFPLTLWTSRILCRIARRRSDHELLSIRSHVEFDALSRQRQRADFRVAPPPPPGASVDTAHCAAVATARTDRSKR